MELASLGNLYTYLDVNFDEKIKYQRKRTLLFAMEKKFFLENILFSSDDSFFKNPPFKSTNRNSQLVIIIILFILFVKGVTHIKIK